MNFSKSVFLALACEALNTFLFFCPFWQAAM